MGILSSIGGLIGLAVGGPLGAALGSGIGTLASGGDVGDAVKSGLMGYGIGSIPGVAGLASQGAQALGMQGAAGALAQRAAEPNVLSALMGGGGAGANAAAGAAAGGGAGAGANPISALFGGGGGGGMGAGMGGGIMGFAQQNPLVMAALLQAAEPSQDMLSPLQKQQLATGERAPGYRGTAAPDYRMQSRQNFATGGYIQGPGTGTSDSVPAKIYQDGGPVQEARLSDGEFVMTADAVRGAGDGNRQAGAAKMYEMMNRLERRA